MTPLHDTRVRSVSDQIVRRELPSTALAQNARRKRMSGSAERIAILMRPEPYGCRPLRQFAEVASQLVRISSVFVCRQRLLICG